MEIRETLEIQHVHLVDEQHARHQFRDALGEKDYDSPQLQYAWKNVLTVFPRVSAFAS